MHRSLVSLGRNALVGLIGAAVLMPAGVATADSAAAPGAPIQLYADTTATTAEVSWAPADASDTSVTGYELDQSLNDGTSWTEAVTTTDTTATVALPGPAHYVLYRVIAQSAAGPSLPSDSVGVVTPGTATQRITIRTTTGQSLTGGDIRWSGDDGTWSGYASLDADGVVNLPSVPAGPQMRLSMSNAYLPNNQTVAKAWSIDFGVGPHTLLVPPPPAMQHNTITVLMPNGVPVVGAEVDGSYFQALSDVVERDGYTYVDLNAVEYGTTGNDGSAVITGWSTEGIKYIPAPQYPWPKQAVDVIYDDGVLHQEGTFLLDGASTTIHLDPMPWLTAPAPSPTSVGTMTSVLFTAHKATAAAKTPAGKRVTIHPPVGWSAKRCGTHKSILTGTTNAHGQVRLAVCSSKSGAFPVFATGAVPTGSITMKVERAAPLAPATASVRSTQHGSLTVTWARPTYAGGAAVTSYTVVATSAGQKSRTFVLRGTQLAKGLACTFTGLARARLWQVSVRATTRYGTSDAVSGAARVL